MKGPTTRTEFAWAMGRLRADRYIARQHGDDLRIIESAYADALETVKESLIVEATPSCKDGGVDRG